MLQCGLHSGRRIGELADPWVAVAAAGSWGICLGPWNLVGPFMWVPPTAPHNYSAGIKLTGERFVDCWLEWCREWSMKLCENAWGACVISMFLGNQLASLPCILPLTRISRDRSVFLWGADHWWFIWGSPAKWSQCFTGFHQSISSAFPPLSVALLPSIWC